MEGRLTPARRFFPSSRNSGSISLRSLFSPATPVPFFSSLFCCFRSCIVVLTSSLRVQPAAKCSLYFQSVVDTLCSCVFEIMWSTTPFVFRPHLLQARQCKWAECPAPQTMIPYLEYFAANPYKAH